MRIDRNFYSRDTKLVARELLGKLLAVRSGRAVRRGRIVETEAYDGPDDKASHAHRGRTVRNAPMFGPPGHAYVYFSYGIHSLLNAVAEPEGTGAAVLIRALEPVEGEVLMRRRRSRGTGRAPATFTAHELCRGPGNLTRALGITLAHNHSDLTSGKLRIEDRHLPERKVSWSRRIGINVGVEAEWRVYDPESAAVSGQKR